MSPSFHRFTETDYLETYVDSPGDIYGATTPIDKAAKNAYTQTRKFVMAQYDLTEAEANTIITQGVDFGLTQVVDGNFGVHGIIPKAIFEQYVAPPPTSAAPVEEGTTAPVTAPTKQPDASSVSVNAASLAFMMALFVAGVFVV